MKFFFCEKCGKRLTDRDLEEGRARDKKLGGVYCKECSVGVLTMETAPLSNDQARALLSRGRQAGDGATVPNQDTNTMKFYFCETCGKRLTEKEIAAGEGRDKKLKGVFCAECAVGVTTMEYSSLTEAQARQLVRADTAAHEDGPGPGAEVLKRRRRRSSRRRAAEPAEADRSSAGRGPSVGVAFGAGIVVVMLAAFLAYLLWPAKNRARVAPAEASREQIGASAETLTAKGKSDYTKGKQGKVNPEPSPDAVVSKSPTPRGSPSSPDPEERDLVAKRKDAPDERPADAGAKEGTQANDVKPTAEAPEPKAAAADHTKEPVASATEAPEAGHSDRDAALERFREALLAVEIALGASDAAKAVGVARGTKTIAELKALDKECEALVTVARVAVRLEKERDDRFAALLDGKTRQVITRRGTLRGEVIKVEPEAIRVRVKARINNQSLEYVRVIKLVDLTPAGKDALFGRFEPRTPDEWVVEMLRKMAGKEIPQAEKAVTEVGQHTLAQMLKDRLLAIKVGEREMRARRMWEKAEKFFAAKRWKEAADAYHAFKKDHAGSQVFKEVRLKLDKRLNAAGLHRAMWWRAFESGEWVSLFNEKDRDLWMSEPADAWKLVKGQVVGCGKLGIRGLVLTDFELEWEMKKLDFREEHKSGGYIGVYLRENENVGYRVAYVWWGICSQIIDKKKPGHFILKKSDPGVESGRHVFSRLRAVSRGGQLRVYGGPDRETQKLFWRVDDVPPNAVGFKLWCDPKRTRAAYRNIRLRKLKASAEAD